MKPFLFTSERLGFRKWTLDDLNPLAEINVDPEVMKYFPSVQDRAKSEEFIKRMLKQFDERGYCYWAIEQLKDNKLIGFIGLSYQDYETEWSPFVDIGWRLGRDYWGKGFATEGARRVLDFGFKNLELQEIYSVAPKINKTSIHVMEKIGMVKVGEFDHPLLKGFPELAHCSTYRIRS